MFHQCIHRVPAAAHNPTGLTNSGQSQPRGQGKYVNEDVFAETQHVMFSLWLTKLPDFTLLLLYLILFSIKLSLLLLYSWTLLCFTPWSILVSSLSVSENALTIFYYLSLSACSSVKGLESGAFLKHSMLSKHMCLFPTTASSFHMALLCNILGIVSVTNF